MKQIVFVVALVGFVSSPLSAKDSQPPKQVKQLLSLTPEHFRDTASLKDDGLETVATITTEPGFQWKQGLLKMVNSDVFIRAFIDKKSGQTTFQVYYFVRYASSEWALLERVNYESIDGLTSDDLTVISRDVESCTSIIGCIHSESVGFNVGEDLLHAISDRYVLASTIEESKEWKFRLKGKNGADADMGIVPAEVKGLLMAVDAYKSAKGLK